MMRRATAGLSLVEITIVVVVLGILATAALPMAEVTARRRDELELRRVLREVRTAIDRFAEDRARRRRGRNWHEHYPRDLDELVEARYLRRVPRDPTTRLREWRLIGTGDPPDDADLPPARPLPTGGWSAGGLPGQLPTLAEEGRQ
ncbi:MAG: type II secretion system protein [Candidatus Riflebacteria bacterium]|nr:type II secretion system protein [Candidatus Riflebacteria bacterium]